MEIEPKIHDDNVIHQDIDQNDGSQYTTAEDDDGVFYVDNHGQHRSLPTKVCFDYKQTTSVGWVETQPYKKLSNIMRLFRGRPRSSSLNIVQRYTIFTHHEG